MAIQCQNCQNENEDDGKFCIHCGNWLASESGEAGDPSETATPTSVVAEIQDIRWFMTRLSSRVSALENVRDVVRRNPRTDVSYTSTEVDVPGQPESAQTLSTQAPEPTPVPTPARSTVWGPEPSRAAGQDPGGRAPSSPALGSNIDWERILGLNWLAIIGVVALTIGAGFFMRLAFENDWIGETGRVVLGIIVGFGLMGVAEYTHRHYPPWAQAVTGGGVGILYLSVYAAFGFYDLIDPIPALIFLGLVAVLSAAQAIRYESLPIALLGIFGAFLTPLLLGKDLDPDQRLWILAYILVVDIGILAISTFRNWRWFTLLGLVGSYGIFGLWLGQIQTADLVVAQVGLTGIFLIFVGATTLFHVVWKREPEAPDMSLITINAIAFYGFTFGLLWDQYETWFGFITLAMSLFYGLVGYAAIARSGASPRVALFALATALVFLTVAMPLQLDGAWITVAWAAEGAILVWVGFELGTWQTRAFGLGVLGLSALRLLLLDTAIDLRDFDIIMNGRFITFAVAIGAAYVSAHLYWRRRDQLEEWEESVFWGLLGAANILTLWILSAEVIAYFQSRSPQLQGLVRDSESMQLLSLTILWALYGLLILAIGVGKKSIVWRWAGLGVLSIATLKLLVVDTFAVNLNLREFDAAMNFPFGTSVVMLAVLGLSLFMYKRLKDDLTLEKRYIIPGLLILANVVVVWMLSTEIVRYFDSRVFSASSTLTDLESAKHLSLTVLWAMYGVAVIAAGIFRQSSSVRLVGIGLLGLAVTKLFIFDVFLLDEGYRVTAFVTLGAILLVTGLAYQKYSSEIRGFLFGNAIQNSE